jgi:sulfur relay (sulfurtransferase) DsrF/TusC family protein
VGGLSLDGRDVEDARDVWDVMVWINRRQLMHERREKNNKISTAEKISKKKLRSEIFLHVKQLQNGII